MLKSSTVYTLQIEFARLNAESSGVTCPLVCLEEKGLVGWKRAIVCHKFADCMRERSSGKWPSSVIRPLATQDSMDALSALMEITRLDSKTELTPMVYRSG